MIASAVTSSGANADQWTDEVSSGPTRHYTESVPETLSAIHTGRLERSCGPRGDSIRRRRRRATGSSASRRSSAAAPSSRTGTTPTRSAITTAGVQLFRYRGADALLPAGPAALPASRRDCTTAGRAPRTASATASSTSSPRSSRRRSAGGRCRSSPSPCSARRRDGRAGRAAARTSTSRSTSSRAPPPRRRSPTRSRRRRRRGRAGGRDRPAPPSRAVREYLDAHPTAGTRAHLLERIARHRPVDDRPPLPRGIRDEPRPLPHHAPAGASPAARSPRARRSPRRRRPPASPTRAT